MDNTPEFRPDGDPVGDAAQQVAASIHQNFMDELRKGEPADFQDVVAAQSERYPHLLFGELAMHIAGVDLPADPTPANRARGVVEAMGRVISTPSLFELVTGAPFSQESASGLQHALNTVSNRDKEELAAATELRTAITKTGYLEQSMIPEDRPVQFQYAGIAGPKRRLLGSDVPATSQEVILKAAPATDRHWEVKTYGRWDNENGFTEPRGSRTVDLHDVCTLLAVESAGLPPSKSKALQRMVGDAIRLGRVTTGTLLKIDYNFTRKTKEVPGYEPRIQNNTWTVPLQLTQVYLGSSSRSYPLFLS